jgi:hypothetical protein
VSGRLTLRITDEGTRLLPEFPPLTDTSRLNPPNLRKDCDFYEGRIYLPLVPLVKHQSDRPRIIAGIDAGLIRLALDLSRPPGFIGFQKASERSDLCLPKGSI